MKLLKFWKPGIWLIIICYLSLMPGNEIPSLPFFNFPHFDKVVHFGFYFVLTILSIKPYSTFLKHPFWFSLITSGLISGLIEILQEKLTSSRHGDFYDFISNLAGIVVAIFLYRFFILGKNKERFF